MGINKGTATVCDPEPRGGVAKAEGAEPKKSPEQKSFGFLLNILSWHKPLKYKHI